MYILLLSILSFAATVSNGTDVMAIKLIELRKQVDSLNQEYEMKKKRYFDEINIVNSQRAEFEANLRNENIRSRQLKQKITEQKNNIMQSTAVDAEFIEIFDPSIDRLKKYIQKSLPVKQSERMAAVTRLEELVKNKEIGLSKAISSLHSMIIDELRMTKENSLYPTSLEIDNKVRLSRVAKVGMVRLYYETADGQYGQAASSVKGWSYEPFIQSEQKNAVKKLMDGLAKQIRTGHYALPSLVAWSKKND